MEPTKQAGKHDPRTEAASDSGIGDDLVQALSGHDSQRARVVADRTRRVVLSSHGVMQEQKRGRSRSRAFAIAGVIIVLLLLAPLVWEAAEGLIAGEHLTDPSAQLALWGIVACAGMLAAVLVAGWLRRRDRE